MKVYFIVLDGASDLKIKELNNLTPLAKAITPSLDWLAKNSQQSMISVIDNDICPESDSGAMSLLSYDPLLYYPGRGTLEGLGTGFIPRGFNFVAFRVNFASYDKKRDVLDRRTSRGLSDKELQALGKSITEGLDFQKLGYDIDFKLLAFGHHRGILCFFSKSVKLSGHVSNTDPGFKKNGYFGFPVKNYVPKLLECEALDNTAAAKVTAKLVNIFQLESNKILESHPVNIKRTEQGKMLSNVLLIRDGGTNPVKFPQFRDKFDMNLSIYGQLPAEKAIGDLIGERFYYSKGFDLQLDKDYLNNMAEKLIVDKTDVVFFHVKGPDEPGHDGLPEKKIEAIEFIDKYFFSKLLLGIKASDIVIVTCDHSTPCELGIHSSDPVPLMIYSEKLKSDGLAKFSELHAIRGSLGIKKGIEILPFIANNLMKKKHENQ